MWEDSENEINMGSTTIPKDPSKPKKKGKEQVKIIAQIMMNNSFI